jgi:hypothetical protein
VPVIGFLGAQSADAYKNFTVPFPHGLKETGYVDAQNGRRGAQGDPYNRISI